MHERLLSKAANGERRELVPFFRQEGPFDCAELFRQQIGESHYREFLLEQSDIWRHDGLTQSHASNRAQKKLAPASYVHDQL